MNLDTALKIAVEAHTGQADKVGQPYILHPLRIMLAMTTDEERMVAALHDVVEDSSVTLEDLRKAEFSEPVVAAVDALTHREGESYGDYVKRASLNPLAKRIKITDLEDNMNFRRIWKLEERDRERMERYRQALEFLQKR